VTDILDAVTITTLEIQRDMAEEERDRYKAELARIVGFTEAWVTHAHVASGAEHLQRSLEVLKRVHDGARAALRQPE
jgi:GTP cyclohydrolase II